MQNISRYRQVDYTGLLGAFIASWILHCVMFAIASTTSSFYPPTADRELISIDLFFASKGTESTASPIQQMSLDRSNEPVEQLLLDDSETEIPSSSGNLELISVKTPNHEIRKVQLSKAKPEPLPTIKKVMQIDNPTPVQIVTPPAEKTPEPQIKLDSTEITDSSDAAPTAGLTLKSMTLVQSEQKKQAVEDEKIRRLQDEEGAAVKEKADLAAEADRAVELENEETEKAAKTRIAAEKARIEQEAIEKARNDQIAKLKQDEERVAKEKIASERAAAENAVKAKMAQTQSSKKTGQKNISTIGKSDSGKETLNSLKKDGSPLQTAAATPQTTVKTDLSNTGNMLIKKQPEQKGLAIPPVKGEIKLTVISTDQIGIKILFVSYPKSRHNKAITKKEALDEQKITPVIVRTAKNTIEAVIERSREGIYIFHAEQKGSKPAQGKFSLKLFETVDKPLTCSEIAGQIEIARLLMPEGIIWEDDTAFSGNIEDSESITKFNSETGLVWKEFRKNLP